MRRVLTHIVFIAIALAITLVGLNFWGNFGNAMSKFTERRAAISDQRDADAARAAAGAQSTPGVVTMTIVPAKPEKRACDKAHPCP